MHFAATHGYEKIVKDLVEGRADPNIKDKDGVRSLYSHFCGWQIFCIVHSP